MAILHNTNYRLLCYVLNIYPLLPLALINLGLGKPFNMDDNIAKLDFFGNMPTADTIILE